MVRGIQLAIHTPAARPGEARLFRPPVLDWQGPEPDYTNYSDPDDRPESPWGWVITDGDHPSIGISQLVFVASDVHQDEKLVLRTLRNGFAAWFKTPVKDWCEVLTRQDLDYLAPRQRLKIEG